MTVKALKIRKQPRPNFTDHPPIMEKDAVSLTAHEFLAELAMYDWEHIEACFDEGIQIEIAWWIAPGSGSKAGRIR